MKPRHTAVRNTGPGWLRLLMIVALATALAACGIGGGGGGSTGDGTSGVVTPPIDTGEGSTTPVDPGSGVTPPVDPTGPGELRSATLIGTLPAAQIAQALEAQGLAGAGLAPAYAVTSYRLEYLTIDAEGREVLASGLVSVPVKAAGARSPVLGYQHPTLFRDAEAPGNHAVASELAVVFASLGYIVVAPDYVGYGASRGSPHPYLRAGPSAAAVVDFLTAAGTWRRRNGVADNGQLFLAGYSEGAYVSMAAHRALQAAGSPMLQALRVVVGGAGPYDVQATLDGLLDRVRDENVLLGSLLDPGLLRYLGSSLRREVREELLKRLLPEDADIVLDTRFIDDFLADDKQAIATHSSVHDWKPELAVRLFHGRDDRTVPYESAQSTLLSMRANGAGDRVSLTDCTAVPSGHIECVPGFLWFMLSRLALHAQDL